MCLFVEDGTIHWLGNTERGVGFMGKDVLFDTYQVQGAYNLSKYANILYPFNIASLGLTYNLGLSLSPSLLVQVSVWWQIISSSG